MARWAAPKDTTGVSLVAGEFAAKDGFLDLPDDLGPGDLGGLSANGFTLASATEEPLELTKPLTTDEPNAEA